QKAANKEMAALKKGSPEFLTKVQEMKTVAADVKEKEAELRQVEDRWKQMMLSIPNVLHESVPVAPDPSGNVVHSTWGDPEADFPHAMPHFDLPWFSESFDFPRGAKVTGAGFPFYVGEGAR